MHDPRMEIFDDLAAELDRIEEMLERLPQADWLRPSAAPGWSVADTVLHLAQTEEMVVQSSAEPVDDPSWRHRPDSVDDSMARHVAEEGGDPAEIFERWRRAWRAALAALRAADPTRRLRWAEAPLKPATLATTRLAEHWAHALDIADPLGLPYPDTDRLHHVAWLGHATLPYAFSRAGLEPQPVRCDLVAPSGARWSFGPPDAESRVAGSMGAFCRVGARRLPGDESGLEAHGPHSTTALRLLRNYAA